MRFAFAALLISPLALCGASSVQVNPQKAALDPERLALIPARMKQLVDQRLGAGVQRLRGGSLVVCERDQHAVVKATENAASPLLGSQIACNLRQFRDVKNWLRFPGNVVAAGGRNSL